MIERSEAELLEKSWTTIRNFWVALFCSLGIYLFLCKMIENQLKPMVDLPFDLIKIGLYGVSTLLFIAAHFVRKKMLKISEDGSAAAAAQCTSIPGQHPASVKYISAIILAALLSESIAIFGLVFFFLSKDSSALYQFIIFSAIAMFIYRPRKEELLEFATAMQKRSSM